MRYRIYLAFRALLCKHNIHDYEFLRYLGARVGELECFYCEHKKHSMGPRV